MPHRRLTGVPGLGQVAVRWTLNDLDPTDWRGEVRHARAPSVNR